MRITSNTYPTILQSQLQYLQGKQLKYQTQIATGLAVQQASDDPANFQQAQSIGEHLSSLKCYLASTQTAQTLGSTNYQAMSDLQKLMSRASELAMRSNSPLTPDEQRVIGDEMGSILDQVVQLANRKDSDGNYLFGGTQNVAPIVKTADGPPPTYEYNNADNLASPPAAPNTPDPAGAIQYTSNVTKIEISEGNIVDTGFVAGRVDDGTGARPAFDGFLCDGTTDILATLTSMRDDLMAGTAVSAADLSSANLSVSLVASYVGKAASRLSVLSINEISLQQQINSDITRIDDNVGADLATAATELQRTQLSYQAALQSGAKILSMSLLDYL